MPPCHVTSVHRIILFLCTFVRALLLFPRPGPAKLIYFLIFFWRIDTTAPTEMFPQIFPQISNICTVPKRTAQDE